MGPVVLTQQFKSCTYGLKMRFFSGCSLFCKFYFPACTILVTSHHNFSVAIRVKLQNKLVDKTWEYTATEINAMLSKNAQFAIDQFLILFSSCKTDWSYHNALFFTGTLASTIGYGNNTPVTVYGKIFCIVFCTLGKGGCRWNRIIL